MSTHYIIVNRDRKLYVDPMDVDTVDQAHWALWELMSSHWYRDRVEVIGEYHELYETVLGIDGNLPWEDAFPVLFEDASPRWERAQAQLERWRTKRAEREQEIVDDFWERRSSYDVEWSLVDGVHKFVALVPGPHSLLSERLIEGAGATKLDALRTWQAEFDRQLAKERARRHFADPHSCGAPPPPPTGRSWRGRVLAVTGAQGKTVDGEIVVTIKLRVDPSSEARMAYLRAGRLLRVTNDPWGFDLVGRFEVVEYGDALRIKLPRDEANVLLRLPMPVDVRFDPLILRPTAVEDPS